MPIAKDRKFGFWQIILAVPALLFMPLWDFGKFLSKKAYRSEGFVRGIFVGLSGIPATIYGALFAANIVGWHYHHGWPLWVTSGLVASALVGGIIWPLFYLLFLKHLWNLGDKLFKLNEKLAKNFVQPLSSKLVGVARHLPLSENLWKISEGNTKPGRKWGIKALSAGLGLAALFVGASAGYSVYHLGLKLIPVFGSLPLFSGVFLSQVIAATVALTAVVFLTGFLFQYAYVDDSNNGSKSVTAIAYSAGFTFLALTKVTFVAALSPIALVAAGVLIFVVSLSYVLPALLALLQGGLMEHILKGWKNLLEAAYDSDKDKDYALFFAQFANIVIALIEAVIAFVVASAVHVPVELVWLVTAIVALYSYASNPRELSSSRAVSPIFGITLAGAAGVASWYFAPASLLAHGFYRFAFGLGMTAFVGLLAYPLAYLLLRVLVKPFSGPVGTSLAALSKRTTDLYTKLSTRVTELQRAAINDTTPFANMFGHLLVIGLVGLAVWQGASLAAPYLDLSFWLSAVVTGIVAINLYMLLSKLSSSFSGETLCVVSGGAALLAAGHWALGISGHNYWAAGTVGIVAALVVGALVAPVVYLVARALAKYLLTPWLAPLLKTLFDGLWSFYVGFWKLFSGLFSLLRVLLYPVIAICAAVRRAYQSVLGRK